MSHSIVTATLIYLAMDSVICYENAYDLLERRNQKFYEPRYFQSTLYNDRNSFFTNNRNPQVIYTNVNPYLSKFGNGYDNLGNGIPFGNFHPVSQQLSGSWRFERRPYWERTFNNFNFDGYPTFRRSHQDFINRSSGGHHPILPTPILSRLYENEFGSKGNIDFSKVSRIIEDNEDEKHKKSNELYQRSQEGLNVDSSKKEKAGEELHSDQTGENKSSLRSNKVIKKGRTTKGFAVHHHKDETGNSTTFFDETSNFGGQSDLRDIADGFGSRKTLEQISHKGEEKNFRENEGRTNNYGSGLLVGNQRYDKDFSSLGDHQRSEKKFDAGHENEDLGPRKTYQYLNGDRFGYAEPHVDNYY